MLRNGRDGDGVESHAYPYPNAYTNTDANSYSRAGDAWKHFDSHLCPNR
jgi:hypothetical protein